MRIRIIIDTQDADDPGANGNPFTLCAYGDDDDGTQTREPFELDGSGCLIDRDIPRMLRDLAGMWERRTVLGLDDKPVPATGEEWRAAPAP